MLDQIKIQLKKALTHEIEEAFDEAELLIRKDSRRFNDFLELQGRYGRAVRNFGKEKLTVQMFQIENNNIVHAFLKLIDSLQEKDLSNQAKQNKGLLSGEPEKKIKIVIEKNKISHSNIRAGRDINIGDK